MKQSEYPPLSEIRNTLRVKWYRCPIEHSRLRALSERTDHQGWAQAGGHLALYVIFSALTIYCWAQQYWIAFFASLWILGFIATFFKGTSVHELGHGTVFKTRSFNSFFLYLFSLISWWDPHDYSASHTYHHRFTTHPEADRENLLPLSPSLHPWLLLQLFTLNLFTRPKQNFSKGGFLCTLYLTIRSARGIPFSHAEIPSQEWLKALHEDQPIAFQQSVKWSRMLLCFHFSIAVLAVITNWWVLILVISMPSYIANIGTYIIGTTQHCGLKENNADFRKNTRSIKLNPVFGFLYWHMNWHTEHHMYAGVPCYNLKALANELQPNMPTPKSVLGAWREMRETWHRQKDDPSYQYDTPVPTPTTFVDNQVETDLVNSIGDLSPKGSRLK